MTTLRFAFVALLGLAVGLASLAQDPPPRLVDQVERATVRLVILDAVVVDRDGRPVPDLARDDFEIAAAGEPRAIDTFDVDCRVAEAEPGRGVASVPEPRRLVIAVDYEHIHRDLLFPALDRVKRFVRERKANDEQVMVVALTGGLRVEQAFTTDFEEAARTIQRMQYDVSLWNGNFSHMSEDGFVGSLTALLDVLGTIAAPKSVVLFSGMEDVPLDLEFERLAALAATSRTAFYPVDVLGLPDELMLARYRGAG